MHARPLYLAYRTFVYLMLNKQTLCSAPTSNFDSENRGAVHSDAVAGLTVVLPAGSKADLRNDVAGTRSSFPGVSRIDPVPGVVLHCRIGLTAAGQRQRAARVDHGGGTSQHGGVFGGV